MRSDWDYCSRCGADLPEDFDFDDDESDQRGIRGAIQSARSSIGSMRVAYPTGATSAVTTRVATGNWRERLGGFSFRRGPSATLLLGAVALGLVLALAVALVVTWSSAQDARDDANLARADLQAAEAEVTRLGGELETSRATIADLESQAAAAQQSIDEMQAELTGGEEERGTLSGEIVDLRQQLSTVQGELDEAVAVIDARDATVAEQDAAISVLSDCLAGMQVALAFARSGQLDSADRAFTTVSETCSRARALL